MAIHALNYSSIVESENNQTNLPVEITASSIIIGSLYGLVILLTLTGNVLVVSAVFIFRRLRSVTNYLLVSLAVADITVAVFVMPYALIYDVIGFWQFGWVFCNIWISCDVMCCTASILHLCVISLDRYWAITNPLLYKVKMSRRKALFIISIVWVCSAAISFIPVFLGWYAENQNTVLNVDSTVCELSVNKIYAVISSVTSFYIPLPIMMFAYLKIFGIARHQASEIRRLEESIRPSDQNLRQSLRKRSKKIVSDTKAIKTLGFIMGIFCICWLPFFLMYLIMPFCSTCNLPNVAKSAITWLGYTNSFINPFVYVYLNRDFRTAFKIILSCKGSCSKLNVFRRKKKEFRRNQNTIIASNLPSGLLEYIVEERRASLASINLAEKSNSHYGST